MCICISIYVCVYAYIHIFLCVLGVNTIRVFKRLIKQTNTKNPELNLAPNKSLENESNVIEEFLKDASEKNLPELQSYDSLDLKTSFDKVSLGLPRLTCYP